MGQLHDLAAWPRDGCYKKVRTLLVLGAAYSNIFFTRFGDVISSRK